MRVEQIIHLVLVVLVAGSSAGLLWQSVPALLRRHPVVGRDTARLFWLGIMMLLFVPRLVSQAFDPPHHETLRTTIIQWVTFPPQFVILFVFLVLPRLRRQKDGQGAPQQSTAPDA